MALEKQIIGQLKSILGDNVEGDIVSYICSMEHKEDYEEFMENIVDKNNSSHVKAYDAIKQAIFGKLKTSNLQHPEPTKQQNVPSTQNKKEKKKFKDINKYQGERKEKIGRTACDCMGQEHEFLNNCVECGRIHCMEEGTGPCLFCGNMITFRGQESFNAKNSKQLMKPKQNKVFDDDNDYFKIKAKKDAESDNKRRLVIALDFATRKVVESTEGDLKIRERLLQDSVEHLKKVERIYSEIQKKSQNGSHSGGSKQKVDDDLVNLLIQMRHKKPAEQENLGEEDGVMPVIDYGLKVFDEDMLATMDHGLCLSMHQPYASLLVAGVKRHEGRTWPTTRRGRLWIAAAAKEPAEEDITCLENYYRQYYRDFSIQFPKEYPTSCLLGCVFIEDCLDQETYRKKFPNGEENSSPYIFICSNPIILPIFYPIAGKHKIYPMDKELHKCAKIALQHATYV